MGFDRDSSAEQHGSLPPIDASNPYVIVRAVPPSLVAPPRSQLRGESRAKGPAPDRRPLRRTHPLRHPARQADHARCRGIRCNESRPLGILRTTRAGPVISAPIRHSAHCAGLAPWVAITVGSGSHPDPFVLRGNFASGPTAVPLGSFERDTPHRTAGLLLTLQRITPARGDAALPSAYGYLEPIDLEGLRDHNVARRDEPLRFPVSRPDPHTPGSDVNTIGPAHAAFTLAIEPSGARTRLANAPSIFERLPGCAASIADRVRSLGTSCGLRGVSSPGNQRGDHRGDGDDAERGLGDRSVPASCHARPTLPR